MIGTELPWKKKSAKCDWNVEFESTSLVWRMWNIVCQSYDLHEL